MAPSDGWNMQYIKVNLMIRLSSQSAWLHTWHHSLRLFQEADSVNVLSESTRCKVDPDHMFGIVGIVGTFLNLLVVVLVYIYTPVWCIHMQSVHVS